MTRYPPAGTVASSGNRYFLGLAKSSVKNQPPMFALFVPGLYNSTASSCGRSVWVSASLIRTVGKFAGAGSARPGEPFTLPLGRQLDLLTQVSSGAFSLTMTREKPMPSVIGYHEFS